MDDRYIQVVRYDDFFPPDQGIEALRAPAGARGAGAHASAGCIRRGFWPATGFPRCSAIMETSCAGTMRSPAMRCARRPAPRRSWNNTGSAFSTAPRSGPWPRGTSSCRARWTCPGFRLLGADQRVAVYVNEAAMPGVAVVPEVQVEPDSARRIATALVAHLRPGQDHDRGGAGAWPSGQAGGTGTAVIEGNGDDTLAVRVTPPGRHC